MQRYILANWKSHKTWPATKKWFKHFLDRHPPTPKLTVIIAPAAVYLAPLTELLAGRQRDDIHLAAQNISPFPLGSYTGAIAAPMLENLAEYVLVGHSDRRRYFHESHQEVANKISEASAIGLKPILCVDLSYATAQFAAVNEVDTRDMLIGYGPVEAIGVDLPPVTPEQVDRAVRRIEEMLPDKPILYGGSLSAATAAQFLEISGLAGLMVGTASLDPEEFAEICRIAGRTEGA